MPRWDRGRTSKEVLHRLPVWGPSELSDPRLLVESELVGLMKGRVRKAPAAVQQTQVVRRHGSLSAAEKEDGGIRHEPKTVTPEGKEGHESRGYPSADTKYKGFLVGSRRARNWMRQRRHKVSNASIAVEEVHWDSRQSGHLAAPGIRRPSGSSDEAVYARRDVVPDVALIAPRPDARASAGGTALPRHSTGIGLILPGSSVLQGSQLNTNDDLKPAGLDSPSGRSVRHRLAPDTEQSPELQRQRVVIFYDSLVREPGGKQPRLRPRVCEGPRRAHSGMSHRRTQGRGAASTSGPESYTLSINPAAEVMPRVVPAQDRHLPDHRVTPSSEIGVCSSRDRYHRKQSFLSGDELGASTSEHREDHSSRV